MNSPADITAALIATLWQKNKPIVEERISSLEKLPSDAVPQQREEAIATAHKLAGSLGMYGYMAASEVAAKIERSLRDDSTQSLAELLKELRQRLKD